MKRSLEGSSFGSYLLSVKSVALVVIASLIAFLTNDALLPGIQAWITAYAPAILPVMEWIILVGIYILWAFCKYHKKMEA